VAGVVPSSASGDIDGWLAPIAVVTIIAVGAGVLAEGFPAGAAGAATLAQLLVAAALSAVALHREFATCGWRCPR
jgi:hypothetical protein